MNTSSPMIGLIYPGEMGAALAGVLRLGGFRVVTTLTGRGAETARRGCQGGLENLGSLADVVRASDVFISIVPPSAAFDLAMQYVRHADLAPPDAIYMEMNSIGPELSEQIAQRLRQCGVAFVDGAINGLAKNLQTTGTMFLSGEKAPHVARLFNAGVRVDVVGDRPGGASAMKMFLSGLSKGVCAMFVESALAAQRHGMLDEMIAAYGRIYPGVMAIVDRMLPTYVQHAARRATETREVERTIDAAGVQPIITAASAKLHEQLAAVNLSSANSSLPSVSQLIRLLSDAGLLAAEPVFAGASHHHDRNSPRSTNDREKTHG